MDKSPHHRFDRFLIQEDRRLIAEKAERWVFEKDQVILQEGSFVQALFILRKGEVRVEKDHRGDPMMLDRLTPGEFMGLMPFLDDAPITVSLVADSRVEVDYLRSTVMHALLESTPGFAVRLYRSLAALLATRLRETMDKVIPCTVE